MRKSFIVAAVLVAGLAGWRIYAEFHRLPENVARQVAELSSVDWSRRCHAAKELGEIGDPAALPALKKAMRDPDHRIRNCALQGIAQIARSSPEAIPLIAESLTDENEDVRKLAGFGLGLVGKEAAPGLAKWLADDRGHDGAVIAFRTMGPAAVGEAPMLVKMLADPAEGVRQRAYDALRAIGPIYKDQVPALVTMLNNHDVVSRRTAAGLLEDFGPAAAPAIPSLARMLETSSEDVDRFVARNALGSIGPQAVPALIELLKSPQPKVRWEALQAFDLSFSAETAVAAWEPVLHAVSDSDAEVRSAALGAAESIAPSAELSRPLVLAAVNGNDPGVRTMAAALLGRPANASVAGRAALLKLSGDSDNQVRLLAVESLGECGQRGQLAEATDPATEILIKIIAAPPNQELTDAALRSLVQIGPSAKAAAPALVGLIERGVEIYMQLAIDALGSVGSGNPEVAVPMLVKMLGSSDQYDRRAAIVAIGKLGPAGSAAVHALAAMLDDEAAADRQAAAESLGRLGSSESLDPLLAVAANDAEPDVREAAWKAVRALQPNPQQVLPALQQAIDEEYIGVRIAAIECLGSLGPAAEVVRPKLLAKFKTDGVGDRPAMAAALAAIAPGNPEVLSALIDVLSNDQYVENRAAAAEALGTMGAKALRAVPALEKAVELQPVGEAAAKALLQIDPDAAERAGVKK